MWAAKIRMMTFQVVDILLTGFDFFCAIRIRKLCLFSDRESFYWVKRFTM